MVASRHTRHRLPALLLAGVFSVWLSACGGGGSGGPGGADGDLCGDGEVTGEESCDDGNNTSGDGCSETCTAETPPCEANQTCPPPPVQCGNGALEASEGCDDGNTVAGDGCSDACTVEPGYFCTAVGGCKVPVCGNKITEGTEECDDGNDDAFDGCTADCFKEPGYTCTGSFCTATLCGDGVVAGSEECEDDDVTPTDGDGCSASCKLEKNFKCDFAGQPCEASVCGNGMKEGLEACDDGNSNWGDACTPDCKLPLSCTNGSCTPVCGDGVILPNDTTEKCDDGNTRANDGCSPTCQIEDGFECTITEDSTPDSIEIPIVYRDFRGKDLTGGHPDFQAYSGSGITAGIVGLLYSPLSGDGKPVLVDAKGMLTDANSFHDWYRDSNRNMTVRTTLKLDRQMNGAYRFSSNAFFPLDGKGWNGLPMANPNFEAGRNNGHNYHFTSEARYWFQYKGTEVLRFDGDDDVWVFINGKLAADVGGMHSVESTNDFQLSNHAGSNQLDLVVGGMYEAVVFQAERRTSGSNYTLTLTGFNAKRTSCEPKFVCGDSQVQAPLEQCDDGTNAGGYGQCAPGCVLGPRCGDGVIQSNQGETCDDGNTVDGDTCPATCKVTLG